jgi:hypothetical protein
MRILGSHFAPNRVELLDARGAVRCGIRQSGPALVVSFAGVREAVQDQGENLQSLATELSLQAAEIESVGETWRALRDFPWRPAASVPSEYRALWRGSVLPSDCAKGMHAVREAVSGCGEVAIAATASHGVLRGVLRASRGDLVVSGLHAAREALATLGGFLVVMDAPDSGRGTVDVWGPMPAELPWMQRIRAAFDRKAILNPGRFIDAI